MCARHERAGGVSEWAILFRHVLKNAAIPILDLITAANHSYSPLLPGSHLLGARTLPSTYPVLEESSGTPEMRLIARILRWCGPWCFWARSTTFILGYLLTDISYTLVDPRVRLE
jgi:peptide/nickel transport system permease protein